MVLVEVGQAVVEEDGRLDVVGDLEAEDAHAGVLDLARRPGVVFPGLAPLRLRLDGRLERG